MTEVEVSTCRRNACNAQFVAGSGIVPDLVMLYEQVRGTKVEPTYPLTRAEVLSMEFCRNCGRDRLFEKYDIKVFATDGTLGIMAQWAEKNAREVAQKQDSQADWEAREQERLFRRVTERLERHGGEDLPPTGLNKIFAEAKPRAARKHKRESATRRHLEASMAHRPMQPEENKSKPSKKRGKGGDKKQKKGGKGR